MQGWQPPGMNAAAGRQYVELVFYYGLMPPEPPYCPPVVGLASGPVGHLLCWDRHERDGSWWAWVSWVQETSARPVHKLVCVPASSLTRLETPDAYRDVPRRVFGRDGRVRPWPPGPPGPAGPRGPHTPGARNVYRA